MLEASSLRSRRSSSSPIDTKPNGSGTAASVIKEKAAVVAPMANDSGTSLSDSSDKLKEESAATAGSGHLEEDKDNDADLEEAAVQSSSKVQARLSPYEDSKVDDVQEAGAQLDTPHEATDSENLAQNLREGALDDANQDEELDKYAGEIENDLEATAPDGEDEGEEDGAIEEEKQRGSVGTAEPESETQNDASPEVVDDASSQQSEEREDDDGDVPMAEEDEDAEDDGTTPAAQTDDEDESEIPEDEGEESQMEDEDDDGEAEEEEGKLEEVDNDDGQEDVSKADVKKDAVSYPQKPTLNRPAQVIEEELKDSGDDLSDLSEFDDSDDSDDDMTERTSSSNTASKAKASETSSSTVNTGVSGSSSRPAPGGRKRSLREQSKELRGQEDKSQKQTDDMEENSHHSDKDSGSEAAEEEGEEAGDKTNGEDDLEEEEDLEKKQRHMDALDALTRIEVGFASLRDKVYDERLLELEKEIEMINDGTHPELSTLMREIEEKREQRLRIAKAWRTHMGEIAQCEFEIKEYQAHCTFQSKKREMRNDIVTDLGKAKRKVILELTLSSDTRRRKPLVRARKQRRARVNELRAIKEQIGFPASTKLRMISTAEMDEDFDALGH
ncbi:hypothetical protein EDD11_007355 [Mortierella claussenii]|nr:hypothetical protein EDD11_007355 [Mortierella claussenii]